MARKLAAALLIALALSALLVYSWSRMALTLTIGSPPIALVQNPAIVESGGVIPGTIITASLNVPSTPGTTLILVASNASSGIGAIVSGMPAGWVQLRGRAETTNADMEIWAYVLNPGGISSVTFTSTGFGADWWCHMSEWSNVRAATTLEASGSAIATSGTTLAPTTGTNVLSSGDLAISAWVQRLAAPGTVTYTTPGGWARLTDSGAQSATKHLDVEYQLNPGTGAPLGPTLTSTGTTTSAAGVIVVLKAAPLATDQSAYLLYDSLTLKLNTLDFTLIDCPAIQQPMATVTLSDPGNYPDWTGTIYSVQANDVVNVRSGHAEQRITATNAQLPNFTGAPFNLTDNPAANTTDIWLLENGDTWALENGSGSWLMESSVQEDSYRDLSIGSQVGSTNPLTLTTIGNLRTFRVGLWPGMTFTLTSSNLVNWLTAPSRLYTIQTITITYQGANPPSPVYDVQFGDIIQTLAQWTKAHAT